MTAEEVELTKDSVAIEQTMQGLTMTAVPQVSQTAVKPKTQPESNPPPNTPKTQDGGKKNNRNKNKKWPTNYYSQCKYCRSYDHSSKYCPKFKTPQDRRSALANNNRCQECTAYIKEGITHDCSNKTFCDKCQKQGHETYLCIAHPPPSK